MFSVKGDTVLDPFMGLATTMQAAMATARNSVGFEIDAGLETAVTAGAEKVRDEANHRIHRRLAAHCRFLARRREEGKPPPKHRNRHYGFPVITRQETDLILNPVAAVDPVAGGFDVRYDTGPPPDLSDAGNAGSGGDAQEPTSTTAKTAMSKHHQRRLWNDRLPADPLSLRDVPPLPKKTR
jgi:hypothetical protein